MNIMGEMIDRGEPHLRRRVVAGERKEIDVVDRAVAVAVDEVYETAADPLDRRNVELHRPEFAMHRLGAERDRPLVGLARIGDAERDRAHRWAVQTCKGLCKALGLGVEDE